MSREEAIVSKQHSWRMLGQQQYEPKLITGALLWHDTRAVAELLVQGLSVEDIKKEVTDKNLLQKRTPKTSANILSYIFDRLSWLPPEVIQLIVSGDTVLSKQSAFLSVVSSSRLFREFLRDVVCSQLESYSPRLEPSFWNGFWDICISHQPDLRNLREKGVQELRAVSLKLLNEVGILHSIRSRDLVSIRFEAPLRAIVLSSTQIDLKSALRCFL